MGLYVNTSGSVANVFAIALVPVLVSVGAAVDYLRMADLQNDLQATADIAALSGAAAQAETHAVRKDHAAKSFQANKPAGVAMLVPDISIVGDTIKVSATAKLNMSLMQLAGISEAEISAHSTAAFGSVPSSACLIALEPSDKEAVLINSNSRIIATDCDIQVNSSNSQAMFGNSIGNATAQKICVKAGSTFSPTPSRCPAIADPLHALPVPSEADDPCDYNDLSISGSRILDPGVYCGKTELNAGANVTFRPGIYVMRNGEFILNSNSRGAGDGVMFYLTGTNNPRFNFNSDSHVDFSAPTSGTYAGIAFFQQRGATADFSILNSDSTSSLEGVVYLPSTPVHLNSFGSLSASTPWTIIIADKLEVNSGSTLRVNANYAASTVPVPAGLGGSSNTTEHVRLIK
jgi:Putative Flp pilus-assembly TadE/G-like